MKFWTVALTCYTWNTVNANWRMEYFFWYCLNTTVRKFKNSNIGTVNAIQKKCICTKWVSILKVHFYSKSFLTSIFICLQSSFLFQHRKRAMKTFILSSTCFCYYRKHPNNDNKICLLPSSSCFQQYFHDWFHVLSYNSDLSKLKWTLRLFNFNYTHDLTNRHKLFSIPAAEYASFSHQARTLKTNVLGLISNFSKCYFKEGTICLLFFSSHVFTAFDSNHFGILLWEIVRPRDCDEIKPLIGKIFRKYKPIRHYFAMSRK